MNNTTDQQQKQYADANNLNDLWKGAIAKFAEKVVVETLQRIIRTDDVEGVLHAILDAESNILSYVDTSGCFHFCVGAATDGDLEVGGDASVEGRVLMENCKVVGSGYESGMFYILDADNHILFEINSQGAVDFKGIPTDIQAALDALDERLKAVED